MRRVGYKETQIESSIHESSEHTDREGKQSEEVFLKFDLADH